MTDETIQSIQKEVADWADVVHPKRTPHSSLAKLVLEEIPEFITSGMEDPSEYADLVIMILDIGHLKGIDVGEAVREKMNLNRSRTWRVDEKTGFLKHIKEPNHEGI